MTNQEVAIQIIYPLVLAVGVPLVIYVRNRLKAYSRRQRQKALIEMDKPDYYQKQQRLVFMQLGLAIYFLGAYLALASSPDLGISWARATFGIVIAVLGGMAGANARTMNEYGVNRQKGLYAKIEEREARNRE